MSTTHSSPPRRRLARRSAAVGAALAATVLGLVVPTAAPVHAASVIFDLYAVAGSAALPSASVAVWGYSLDGSTPTKPGGPTLVAHQGDVVTITLHNQLTETNSLVVRGQSMPTDRVGAATGGGTKSYTFTAD